MLLQQQQRIVTDYYHFDGDDEFDSYYIFSLVLDSECWCFFRHDDLQQQAGP